MGRFASVEVSFFLFHLPSFLTSSFLFQEATTAARPHRQEALGILDGAL